MATDYIIPTKQSPVFTAYCEDFGTIEASIYKDWNIKKVDVCSMVGSTFALHYHDAVINLHEWIKENADYVKGLKKINFVISEVDGSMNGWGEVKYKPVYSINPIKARKYLL